MFVYFLLEDMSSGVLIDVLMKKFKARYPDAEYKSRSAIITNFHLPKSTLIMLISAFAGRNFILSAYKTAVEQKYRFFSFGDAMFIQRPQPLAERTEELKELEALDRQREAEKKE